MSRAIESYRYTGRVIPIEETVDRIMSVSGEEVSQLAAELFKPENLVALAFGDIPGQTPDIPMEFVRREIEDIIPQNPRTS